MKLSNQIPGTLVQDECISRFFTWPLRNAAKAAEKIIFAATVLVAVSVFSTSSAQVDGVLLVNQIALADTSDNCESGAEDCLADFGSRVSLLPENLARATDSSRESAFGIKFGLLSNKVYRSDRGFGDSFDAVVPLVLTQRRSEGLASDSNSGIFLQQGVTNWRDDANGARDDVRTGVILNFRPFGNEDEVGVSVFYERNLQAGHRVLTSSLGFDSHWGGGSLRHITPLTEWINIGSGVEERVLEGFEMDWKMKLTSTFSAGIVGYRWQRYDDDAEWTEGVRTNLEWRPRSYVTTRLEHDKNGDDPEGQFSAWVGFTVPLGGGQALSNWQVMEVYPRRAVRRDIVPTEETSD